MKSNIAVAPGCGVGTYQDGTNGDGTPNCVPDEDGGGGGGGGGGSTGGGGGGGGGTVATGNPQEGLNCDGSPSVLGTSNLPMNSSGAATTVTDIFGFNSADSTYGWLYQTQNGDTFFQRNAADAGTVVSALTSFFSSIPVVAPIVNSLIGATSAPYEITPTQLSNIKSAWDKTSGHAVHACFNKALSA